MTRVDQLTREMRRWLGRCSGIAPAVRTTTSFNSWATRDEMIAAGQRLKLNPNTVAKQFAQAKKEDAEVEAATKDLTDEEIIEAIIRTNNQE